jgi:hypothetical protein
MRIGVISDTHDRLPTIRAALDYFKKEKINTLVHPGDVVAPFAAKLLADFPGKLHIVYGNNDGERAGLRKTLPQIQDGPLFVKLGGKQVLIHHALDWCHDDDLTKADIVLTGHTHAVQIEREEGKLLLNPGECCGWVTGKATIAVVDLKTTEAEIIELPT